MVKAAMRRGLQKKRYSEVPKDEAPEENVQKPQGFSKRKTSLQVTKPGSLLTETAISTGYLSP